MLTGRNVARAQEKKLRQGNRNRGDSEQRPLQAMWEQNQEKKKNGGGGNEHGSAPKRQSTQQDAREDKAIATLEHVCRARDQSRK